jgi:hypothetical protein
MSVALLLLIVAISLTVVRVAAVALELTGIPWERAKFHALSAFSNTGLPTPRSAEIAEHPVRRRIAGYLMVLGKAGLITTIATLASTLMTESLLGSAINVGIAIGGVLLLVWLMRRKPLVSRLRTRVRRVLIERYGYQLHEEQPAQLLHLSEGYALSRLEVSEAYTDSVSLSELTSFEAALHIVGVERHGVFDPTPDPDRIARPGDELIVYGPRVAVARLNARIRPVEETAKAAE